MRYGVFGGSFDPPHMSHVLACLWAVETGEVDRVLMIPTAQHAFGKKFYASFEDRVDLCRAATSRLSDFVEVLDMEGNRRATSYTIDTLETLIAERPGNEWRLLIGSDILDQTQDWKEWDQVERMAPPLVIPRLTGQNGESVSGSDLRTLSSTALRERLSSEESVLGLIPESVWDLIRKRGLYGVEISESFPPDRSRD